MGKLEKGYRHSSIKFEGGSLLSSIEAEKEKSILFPEYLNANKYKEHGWQRMVGQYGFRYISQESAVKITTDEIRMVKIDSIKKKELDKLYSI